MELNEDNPILLKIYRQYEFDESIKYLFEEISRLKLVITTLNTEKSILLEKSNHFEDLLTKASNGDKEIKKDIVVRELNEKVQKLEKSLYEERKKCEKWQSDYILLKSKLNS